MRLSIRKFLLINLLLVICVTTTLTTLGNYYLDKKDIQNHLDTLMAMSAMSYQALLDNDLDAHALARIQKALNHIPKKIATHSAHPRSYCGQSPQYYLDAFSVQVFDKQGNRLLHSSNTSNHPIDLHAPGFHDTFVGRQQWRSFTTCHQQTGLCIVLSERYDTRNELGQRIAEDDLFIMLLTFPLSGLLIWMIIGEGLKSLNRVAQEVSNRAASHLEPVDIEELPKEITPVIDELNKLFFRLKAGFEREKRFAADAAHELRTPLAALKAQAQVALNTDNLEQKDIALRKLLACVNRSTHIVQQLLTMSKLVPESSGINDLDTINLAKITPEIVAMLAPAAVEKHIELEFNHAPSSVHNIIGNAMAISILIRNLVDNAIRYTYPNGRVVIEVYRENQHVVLAVSDNGPGIPKALQQRVFERFYRVLGNKSPGSGLGLAIVQQIAALHDANVILESPSTGTGLIVKVLFNAC